MSLRTIACTPCYSPEDHAVQQRVPAEAVVAVHAACNLARGVEAHDGLARRGDGGALHVCALSVVQDEGWGEPRRAGC